MTSLRVLSTAFGLVMAAAAALRTDGPALLAAAAAAIAVLIAVPSRVAATLAVLCCVAALTMSEAPPVPCALAGFAATWFLVLGRAAPPQPVPVPTVVAVLAATGVGLVATAVPVALPWAPLAAPPAACVAFVVTVHALRRRLRTAAGRPSPVLRENEV